MEQRRREQDHHEKQQELQQLKHKDKSQQSESLHIYTHTTSMTLTCCYKFQFTVEVVFFHIKLFSHIKNNYRGKRSFIFIEQCYSPFRAVCFEMGAKYNRTSGTTTVELNIALGLGTSH